MEIFLEKESVKSACKFKCENGKTTIKKSFAWMESTRVFSLGLLSLIITPQVYVTSQINNNHYLFYLTKSLSVHDFYGIFFSNFKASFKVRW